jgi:hypothetical protein
MSEKFYVETSEDYKVIMGPFMENRAGDLIKLQAFSSNNLGPKYNQSLIK